MVPSKFVCRSHKRWTILVLTVGFNVGGIMNRAFCLLRRAFVFAFLALSFCLTAAADAVSPASMMQTAVRIRYERIANGCTITGHGTAFGADLSHYGFNGNRYLLTAAHNVLDDHHKPFTTLKIEIRYADGRELWAPVRPLVWDEQLDLCLVESSQDLPAIAQLSDYDMSEGGDLVLAGSPRGVPVGTYQGTVMTRFHNATVRTAAKIPFDHGDSGGPFFCARTGRVVGVAVAGVPKDGDLDHSIGLFVPMVGVTAFLEQNSRVRVEPRLIAVEKSAPAPVAAVAEPAIAAPTPAVAAAVPAIDAAPAKESTSLQTIQVAVADAKPEPAVKPLPKAPVIEDEGTSLEVVEIRAPRASKPAARDPLPTPSAATIAASAANVQNTPVQMPMASGEQPSIVKAVYVVQLGDNLTAIAKRHNVSLHNLLSVNELKDPNVLRPGMKLNIP
jgi:LysM repeat protein